MPAKRPSGRTMGILQLGLEASIRASTTVFVALVAVPSSASRCPRHRSRGAMISGAWFALETSPRPLTARETGRQARHLVTDARCESSALDRAKRLAQRVQPLQTVEGLFDTTSPNQSSDRLNRHAELSLCHQLPCMLSGRTLWPPRRCVAGTSWRR